MDLDLQRSYDSDDDDIMDSDISSKHNIRTSLSHKKLLSSLLPNRSVENNSVSDNFTRKSGYFISTFSQQPSVLQSDNIHKPGM